MQDDFGLIQIKTPVIQIPDEKNSIYAVCMCFIFIFIWLF